MKWTNKEKVRIKRFISKVESAMEEFNCDWYHDDNGNKEEAAHWAIYHARAAIEEVEKAVK